MRVRFYASRRPVAPRLKIKFCRNLAGRASRQAKMNGFEILYA
jgi:hypothetical protein